MSTVAQLKAALAAVSEEFRRSFNRETRMAERIAELEEALADERARTVIRLHLTREDREEIAEILRGHLEECE